MTGRGRGVRARKIEKPRPLRSLSTGPILTGGHVNNSHDNVEEVKKIINNIDTYVWDEDEMERVAKMLTKKGPEFERECPDDMNTLFNSFREAIRNSHISPMIRCLLLEILEKRSHKWGQTSIMSYYDQKKVDLQNYNIEALQQASKRPVNNVPTKRKEPPTADDINWEPPSRDSSVLSTTSSISGQSSNEDMDLCNGNVSNTSAETGNTYRPRGRGSRRSSKSSEGSVRRMTEGELPLVGRTHSRTSTTTDTDEVFDQVDGSALSQSASVPSSTMSPPAPEVTAPVVSPPTPPVAPVEDLKKDPETSLHFGKDVLRVSSTNKILLEGVHKLILRYRFSLEKFLIDGFLDTNTDRRAGGQGYYMPKRVRTSSFTSENRDFQTTRQDWYDNGSSRDNGSYPRDNSSYSRDNGSYHRDNGSFSRDNGSYPRDNGSYPRENQSDRHRNSSNDNQSLRYRDSFDGAGDTGSQFSNTPVVARLSEAIESYEDKKKEDVTYDAGLDWYATKEVEKASGILKEGMGFSYSSNLIRQPILPTSSLAYVTQIQRDLPGGAKSAKERRVLFSKTSHKYWNKVKKEAHGTEGAPIISYPKDFLLFCGSSAAASKRPSFCNWDALVEKYKEVCLDKVNNVEIAMRIFNYSNWNPDQSVSTLRSTIRTGGFGRGPRNDSGDSNSSQTRSYPLSADSTTFTRPNFEPYTRSKSVEERTSNIRPWDIGKPTDPEDMFNGKQNPSSFSRREFNFNFSSTMSNGRRDNYSNSGYNSESNSAEKKYNSGRSFDFSTASVDNKEFNFSRSFGTTTDKFSVGANSSRLDNLIEENH